MITKLYGIAEKIWFAKAPEKLRFILVGGFNSLAAYLIFLALYFLFRENYGAAIIGQNAISINISIFTMRHYVFRSRGDLGKEYAKALPIYALMICANYPWLWIFDEMLGISAPFAQPAFMAASAIGTYVLLKYFSFKKRRRYE